MQIRKFASLNNNSNFLGGKDLQKDWISISHYRVYRESDLLNTLFWWKPFIDYQGPRLLRLENLNYFKACWNT